MKNIYLKIPKLEELKYRKKWMNDQDTMEYNAGYDINIKGYNKETGTLFKTDEELLEWYDKWINKEPDRFFAYIYDYNIDEPIGEIYYYLENNIHSMGIVIDNKYRGKGYSYLSLIELEKVAFEKNHISELSDYIPLTREAAIKSFQKAGFIQTESTIQNKKFDKEEISKQLLITNEMYNSNKNKI